MLFERQYQTGYCWDNFLDPSFDRKGVHAEVDTVNPTMRTACNVLKQNNRVLTEVVLQEYGLMMWPKGAKLNKAYEEAWQRL